MRRWRTETPTRPAGVCTFTYLAYVYVRSQSVWVTAFAHITMNNGTASVGYLFILENQFMANVGTVLVMAGVIGLLWRTGRLTIFNSYFETKGAVAVENVHQIIPARCNVEIHQVYVPDLVRSLRLGWPAEGFWLHNLVASQEVVGAQDAINLVFPEVDDVPVHHLPG